jgi:hypothetical protein
MSGQVEGASCEVEDHIKMYNCLYNYSLRYYPTLYLPHLSITLAAQPCNYTTVAGTHETLSR